jgi:antitoxin (DNA-binding transcriptional repressor) of toxin-antitoxin stability system
VLTTVDTSSGETDHWWPEVLPGAQSVPFTSWNATPERSRISVVSLSNGQVTTLVSGGSQPRFAPIGHLVSAAGGVLRPLSNMATSGYHRPMTSTGIRELKDNLSRYIRRIEAGERIAITAHGRVVAELVPPGSKTTGTPNRFDELVASGVIRPPLEAGDPTEGWPDIRLPAGTAAELIDADRGEA